MLILRLVSGVTISVFEKSMLPSPGCGIGNPTPIPACTGTTELEVFWELVAPAGGRNAILLSDGIIMLSFELAATVVDTIGELPEIDAVLSAASVGGVGFAVLPAIEGTR